MNGNDLPEIFWQIDREFLAQSVKYGQIINAGFLADTPRTPYAGRAEELVPFSGSDNADVAPFQYIRSIGVRRITRRIQIVRVLGKITA
jgi:hypothetical protein